MADEQMYVESGVMFHLEPHKGYNFPVLPGGATWGNIDCNELDRAKDTIKDILTLGRREYDSNCQNMIEGVLGNWVPKGHGHSCVPSHVILAGDINNGVKYPFEVVEGDMSQSVENGLAAFNRACGDLKAQKSGNLPVGMR